MATPERASGWIATAMTVFEKGGPATMLILALCTVAMVWGLYRELGRVHHVSLEFFHKLETCYQAQLTLARQCPHDGGTP